jgi:hypothetical protein
MLRAVPRSGGARRDPSPDDRLRAATQEAVAAFTAARSAFDELERTHEPNEYTVLAERLRSLGEALSEVQRHAIARRQEGGEGAQRGDGE